MSLSIFLQLFLLTDVFFVGVLVAVAARHAQAHFRTPKLPPVTVQTIAPKDYVSPAMREQLVRESQKHFEAAVSTSTSELQQNLSATASELDQLLRKLGGEIVGNELERYRLELGQLRQQAQADMGVIKTEISSHRAELEQQLVNELAAEKQHLLQQIDAKLGDAVSSFLLETLQHNIDLGAQEAYLRALLEEHKADFIKEVADESNTAS